MARAPRTSEAASLEVVINADNRGARVVRRGAQSAPTASDEKPADVLLAVPIAAAAAASQEFADAHSAFLAYLEAPAVKPGTPEADALVQLLADVLQVATRLAVAGADLSRTLASSRRLTVGEGDRILAAEAPPPAAAAPVVNVDLSELVAAVRELANREQVPPVVNVDVQAPADRGPKVVDISRDDQGRLSRAVVKEI